MRPERVIQRTARAYLLRDVRRGGFERGVFRLRLEDAQKLRDGDACVCLLYTSEPALDPAVIEQLVRPFLDGTVQVSTLATPISPERAASPNQVKVVTAANGDALYFSCLLYTSHWRNAASPPRS